MSAYEEFKKGLKERTLLVEALQEDLQIKTTELREYIATHLGINPTGNVSILAVLDLIDSREELTKSDALGKE